MDCFNNDTGTIYEKDTNFTIAYTLEQSDSLFPNILIAKIVLNGKVANSLQQLASDNVVYFRFKKYKIDPEYYPVLNSAAANLKTNKETRVNVNGYTDNMGKTLFNKKLSLLRANAVAKYLYHKGIRHSRIKCKGYGATHFVAPNDAEHNHLNRRQIEFIK